MITIEGLKKSYAGRPVLQGIDLTVKSGELRCSAASTA
jgi:phosphonate transport system ATP-binding protein